MSRIRYSKQRRKYDCAAVVFVNAIKFYGGKVSYCREYQSLCDILGVERDMGCEGFDLKELIELSDVPYKIKEIKENPKIKHLKNHLTTGNAVIFIYNEHVSLITHFANKTFTLINHFSGVTISKLDNTQVKEILKGPTWAFLLEKK